PAFSSWLPLLSLVPEFPLPSARRSNHLEALLPPDTTGVRGGHFESGCSLMHTWGAMRNMAEKAWLRPFVNQNRHQDLPGTLLLIWEICPAPKAPQKTRKARR